MEENKTDVSTETTNVEEAATKKKSKMPIIIAILLVVAVVGVLVALNFKVINNSIKKATMSNDKYAQYVLIKNAEKNAEYYGKMYDKSVLSLFEDNIEATTTLSFQVTEEGFEFLEDNDVDVENLEDIALFKEKIALSYTCKHDGDLSYLSVGASAGKESLASTELIFDKANQMVYIRFPEFGEDYAAMDLEDFYDDDEIDELFEIIDSIDEIGNILIPADKLEGIIKRYQKIALEQITDVDMSTETLEVGDLEQKVTVLEVELDMEDIANIFVAVAEELIEDEEIKGIVEDISEIEYIEDADEFVEDYEQMLDELEDALDDIEDELDDADEDVSVTLSFYVNNKGEIIGSKAYMYNEYSYESYDWDTDKNKTKTVEREMEVFFGYIIKGGKFAVEMYMEEDGETEMSIEGEGKANGSKLTGEFTAEVDDEELVLNIEDLDWNKLNEGIVDAKISFDFDQFGKDVPKAMRDLSIVVSLEGSKDTYGISLSEDGTALMTLEVSTTVNNKTSVSVPKNTVEVADAEDIADYIEDLDFSKIDDIIDDMDLDFDFDTDDIIDEVSEEIGEFVEDGLPIEILLVPEIGMPTSPFIPILAGIMAPQMIRYAQHAGYYY